MNRVEKVYNPSTSNVLEYITFNNAPASKWRYDFKLLKKPNFLIRFSHHNVRHYQTKVL